VKRANRLLNMPPYPFARWAAQVAEARQKGLDVIRLDMGNPDMPPPDEVIETLCQSAHQPDLHGYPGYRGTPELRGAMAQYYERRFGVQLDPDTQVMPLLGSKEGIVHIALASLDPGDLALVPDPGYTPYTMGVYMAGAEVYTFPLLAAHDFLPDFDGIPADVANRASLMWLNYPNNPTGATADLNFFAQAVDFARKHDLLLCHDVPYCDVTYDGYVAPSLLQVEGASEVAIELNSLSKTYTLARVKTNIDSGICRPLQEAAITALSITPEWLAARNEIYKERIAIVAETLEKIGMAFSRPRATLYVWVRVPQGWESGRFALSLLEETGVSLSPGPFFGPAGEGYVRISVTAPTERVREAMERLRRFAAS